MLNEYIIALACCLLFLTILILIELIVRKGAMPSKISRRLAHLASGLFSLFMWLEFSPAVFLVCTGLLIVVIAISYAKRALRSIHNVERKTHGEIYLPVGIFITYLIAHEHPDVFVPAILIMTFSDVVSGVISDWRDKGRASRWGSVGFLLTTLTILLIIGISPMAATSLALILMAVELISPYGSDNLTIPITASILLLL